MSRLCLAVAAVVVVAVVDVGVVAVVFLLPLVLLLPKSSAVKFFTMVASHLDLSRSEQSRAMPAIFLLLLLSLKKIRNRIFLEEKALVSCSSILILKN